MKYIRCDRCGDKHEITRLNAFKVEYEEVELLCDDCYNNTTEEDTICASDLQYYTNDELLKMRRV